MFTIPDKGEGQNDIQSIVFQEDIDAVIAGVAGSECVLNGLAVTPQASANMQVQVALGCVLSQGVMFAVAANSAVPISAANASDPRIDLVVITSAGAIAVRAGTPAAAPKPPARTAGDVMIAAVWVPAADTTISADQIVDKRVMRTQGPILIGKSTSGVTFNTTNAIQTYFSLTIPRNLLVAGKQLAIRAGGNYLSNGGTGTWTFTVSYGGAVMWADATGATTTDADRGSWDVDLVITAQANNAQRLNGRVTFQTPGAKNAPSTGTAGDLAVTTHITSPVRGVGTVDVTAADQALLLRWTMSASNAAAETVMDHAYCTLT